MILSPKPNRNFFEDIDEENKKKTSERVNSGTSSQVEDSGKTKKYLFPVFQFS
jgi:hypothetical protein